MINDWYRQIHQEHYIFCCTCDREFDLNHKKSEKCLKCNRWLCKSHIGYCKGCQVDDFGQMMLAEYEN